MTTSGRRLALTAGLGYLLGTLPSADIATRRAATAVTDLRQAGSGNPGATNAAAVLGRGWGLAVLAADVGKGAAAGAVGRAIAGSVGGYAAGLGAIAGHIMPVWSRGRGGKGVATAAGACISLFPAVYPVVGVAGVGTAVVTRRSERAMQAAGATWIAASVVWWRQRRSNWWGPPAGPGLVVFALGGAAMVITKFRFARPPT